MKNWTKLLMYKLGSIYSDRKYFSVMLRVADYYASNLGSIVVKPVNF